MNDIFVVIEDASDIISASQIFICGLLVGRSHGAFTVSDVILLMVEINKIQDLQLRQRLDHMLLTTNNLEDARKAIEIYRGQNQGQNNMNMGVLAVGENGDIEMGEEGREEQIKVIEKELGQMDVKINGALGLANECPFKKEAEQIESLKNEVENLYHIERLKN